MIRSNVKFSHKYDIVFSGHNYRLSDINCALGLSQLKRIDTLKKKEKRFTKDT